MNCHRLLERRIGALIALSFVTGTMLAASCADDDDETMHPRATEADTKPAHPAAEHPTPDDGGIHRTSQALHVLITVNDKEVEQSSLAQQKASNDRVKEFAAMIVTEHRAANDRLAGLAQQKAITPEANPTSDSFSSEAESVEKRLEPLSGSAFDKTYMEAQIVAHVKVRALIDEVLKPALADPDLEREVADLRTGIDRHLLEAEEIRKALGFDASVQSDASTSVTSSGDGGRIDAGRLPVLDAGGLLLPGQNLPDRADEPDLGGLNGLLRDGGMPFDFQ